MIFTPGLDEPVGDLLGRLRREPRAPRRRPPRRATTCSRSASAPHRDAAELLADQLRVDVEDRDDPEAVVGEDVGAGDRLAEVAGAEQGDVVLARGAQDLADLGDQRLDPVADAALAELAEPGEVAADLGRVDVRVLGELLRGDRLPAHLARLDQHLQVAREARRDPEREPLAVGQRRRPAVAASAAVRSLDRRGRSRADSMQARARNASRSNSSSLTSRRRPRPPGSARGRRRAGDRRPRCRPRAARTRRRSARSASDRRARLVAEVAAGAAVERHDRSGATGHGASAAPRVPARGSPGYGVGSTKRAAEAIIAALSVQSSRGDQLQRAGPALAQSSPTRSRSRPFAATPPPSATASQPPPVDGAAAAGSASQLDAAGRRPRPGSSPRGRRGARPPPAVAEVADGVEQRRLQAAEAEVEAAGRRLIATGKLERLRVAVRGLALDRRARPG